MPPKYDLCIYHANCPDGTTSAWVAKLSNPSIELHAASYGDTPPDVRGKSVLVCDFSYPREILLQMIKDAAVFQLLDHHKTAVELASGLPGCEVDMNRSGARMAWDHLFPNLPPPWVVRYVEDRDLWRFALPHTMELNAYINAYGYKPATWSQRFGETPDNIEFIQPSEECLAFGVGALQTQKILVEQMVAHHTFIQYEGHQIPMVCAPVLNSDAGHALLNRYPEAPFCIVWRPNTKKGFYYSLRSHSNGFDVSALAAQFGGGGHRSAAAFSSLVFFPLLTSLHLPQEQEVG